MKKNDFANEYKAYKEIEARFDAANEADDKEAAEAARAEVITLYQSIEDKGEEYASTYWDYRDAMECGNDCIDLHDAIWDEQVPALIERLRNFGIEEFTFSSTWSGAVQTAWLFTENGCTLEGMTRINGTDLDWKTEGYSKVPAYIFRID